MTPRNVALAMVLLAGALPGCAALGLGSHDQAGPNGICEREADDDPTVKAIRVTQLGNPVLIGGGQQQLARARRQAVTACLRRHSLAPAGGVEAPQ